MRPLEIELVYGTHHYTEKARYDDNTGELLKSYEYFLNKFNIDYEVTEWINTDYTTLRIDFINMVDDIDIMRLLDLILTEKGKDYESK